MDATLEQWFDKECQKARNTVEYWQERATVERGEVMVLEARVKELEEERRKAAKTWNKMEKETRAYRRKVEANVKELAAGNANLRELLKDIADEPDDCILCGADTRTQKDCRSCATDHMGSKCFRRGEHAADCRLKPYETVRRVHTNTVPSTEKDGGQ